ncbi:protein huluwa isoform X1 [Alosa alosa]|uniref:protein huluwa isoform X2 n=1 Tax=Alosa sapidissima TaxID=34773 RepID=UPI001C08F20C|nr:protein huluwa isoform X2 [Alosa sapidissima]XP_048114944.1 protein huluwa isoform X1 [Alosa alosa]
MDQPVSATPSVTANIPGLTIVIILLVPCLLLVLLLNCLLLGHKLLLLAGGKTRVRTSSQCSLLQSTRQRVSHFTDGPSFSYPNGRTYGPVSRPILAMPVTSSLTSSQERVAGCLRSTQPDGATCAGSGSLPVPSTLLAATSTTGSAARAGLPRRARAYFSRPVEWRRFPLEPTQSSDSDVERANTVPPNSPAPRCCGPLRQSSTLEVHSDVELGFLNQVHMECEFASSIPPENSYFIPSVGSSAGSAVGPGLDSDFGASAGKGHGKTSTCQGVSLRILSADSEAMGCGLWASALEWDYYDPSYITQNQLRPPRTHAPSMAPKQYWI